MATDLPESTTNRSISRLDRVAIGLSSVCLIHCVATVLLAATLASAGAALANPAWHEIGFALAMLIGAVALGRGYLGHHDWRPLPIGGAGLALMGVGLIRAEGLPEIVSTMAGVALLAFAHRLNARGHGGDARGDGGHSHRHDLVPGRRHA